jgi:5-methylcytosine-specific restriction endonuclease McrA
MKQDIIGKTLCQIPIAIVTNYIYVENPNPKSRASYILLKNELFMQDESKLTKLQEIEKWLKFRAEYLQDELKNKGELICTYCGKRHLEIGYLSLNESNKNHKNPLLATIDHIMPLGKGGEKYNKNNLCVACKTCNSKKADKIITKL